MADEPDEQDQCVSDEWGMPFDEDVGLGADEGLGEGTEETEDGVLEAMLEEAIGVCSDNVLTVSVDQTVDIGLFEFAVRTGLKQDKWRSSLVCRVCQSLQGKVFVVC